MLGCVETVIQVGYTKTGLYSVILFVVDCGVRNMDCVEKDASHYSGAVNTTVRGYDCKDDKFCRGDSTWRPWCYTTSKDRTWDYCPIRDCEECDKSKISLSR